MGLLKDSLKIAGITVFNVGLVTYAMIESDRRSAKPPTPTGTNGQTDQSTSTPGSETQSNPTRQRGFQLPQSPST